MKSSFISSCLRLVTSTVLVTWPVALTTQTFADSCLPPAPGLVAWWPGDGNAFDCAGTNHGSVAGTVLFMPGEVGQAFRLNGAIDNVQIPASSELDVGAGNGLTLVAWINPDDVSTYQPLMEWSGINGFNWGAHFWISVPLGSGGSGSVYANLFDVSGGAHYLSSVPGLVVPHTWSHVAVTYDRNAGAATLYCNGSSVATAQLGTFVPQTSAALNLGYRPYDGTHFTGLLDELAIYSRALSSNEVAAIYAAGSAGHCKTPAFLTQPQGRFVVAGKSVALSVSASGAPPMGYQWLFNGTNLLGSARVSGVQSRALSLASAQFSDAGTYQVVVTNALGSATSAPANLVVFARAEYGDAVADFSTNSNPNGVWTYGWSSTVGSTFQLMTNLVGYSPGVSGYWNGQALPGSCGIWGNSTGVPILAYGTVWMDPDTLLIDPESYAAVVRFTAATDGVFQVQGLFRLQNTMVHADDLTIQVNSSLTLFSRYTQGGQLNSEYPFDLSCTLRTGDRLDFIVSCHGGDYVALATGLKATVVRVSSAGPQIQGPQLEGGDFSFDFPTILGQSYTIQKNAELGSASWIDYTNLVGDGSLRHFVVPVSTNRAQFFRVRMP